MEAEKELNQLKQENQRLMRALDDRDAPQTDDMTVIVIKRIE